MHNLLILIRSEQEQPTQFYATMFALVYLNAYDNLTVGLAWTYVGLRVIHSLVHAISNPM